MKIFAFDPADYREQYRTQGWVHIRNGVTREFFAALRQFADEHFAEHQVEGRAIAGAKTQALYEFPTETAFPDELFDVVAATCGLERETMTLSERHVKWYDADADPNPTAHKDRLASKVSMGISIHVPKGSELLVYPRDHVSVNPFNVSATFPQSLGPEERPEVALKDAQPVVIEDQPGDVMMFPGSAVWHLRRKPAGAMNLYLKLNDFNSDPLGEDPTTPAMREATVAALDNGRVDGMRVLLGRRMDAITRLHTRHLWDEVLLADVWDSQPVRLTDAQFRVLQQVDGRRTFGDLLAAGASRDDLVRLAECGVLDLVA